MNKFLVAVFDSETAAFEGLNALEELHKQGDVTLYATAVMTKDAAGLVSIKKEADQGPLGAALGMLIGGFVGILAGPVGVAAGATAGYTTGMLLDLGRLGFNSDFVDKVSNSLEPGKAAVLADMEETWVTPVDTRLGQLGASILRRPRYDVVSEQVNQDAAQFAAELNQLDQELAMASAENKATVQKEINAVRKQMAATRAEIDAALEQANREANTKVNALNAQMKQANDRQKAQIEKRITQVKADHAERKAKLDQARKLTGEALLP